MTWTPERIAELERLRAKGLGSKRIARAMGLTRGQVVGKLNRMNGYKHPSRAKMPVNDWDRMLFEPWTEFRARRVAERAQMQA